MPLAKTLADFASVLDDLTPDEATRLRPGLNREEIQSLCAGFRWNLPREVAELYQWHDGLTRVRTRLTLMERVMRQKDRWHGELSGRENEVHFLYDEHPCAAKFMPLEFALAGHRHLKLGRCPLDLLPVFILHTDWAKWYCMFRLETDSTVVYCVNGSKVPPRGIGESVLSANPRFKDLAAFATFLTRCGSGLTRGESLSATRLKAVFNDHPTTSKSALRL